MDRRILLLFMAISLVFLVFISGCAEVVKTKEEEIKAKIEKANYCDEDSDCSIGGCSGQVCTTKDKAKSIITTCEYLPIYDCYKQTTCSCIDSKCQWKETERFLECKAKVSQGEVVV